MSLENENNLKLEFPVYSIPQETENHKRTFKKQPKPGQAQISEQITIKYDLKRTTLFPDDKWSNFKPLTPDMVKIYDDSIEDEEIDESETEVECNLLLPKELESIKPAINNFGSFGSSGSEFHDQRKNNINKKDALKLPMIRKVINTPKHENQLTEEELFNLLYPNVSTKIIPKQLLGRARYSSHGVVLSSSFMVSFQKYDYNDTINAESKAIEQNMLSSKFDDTSSEASIDLDREMNTNHFVEMPTAENQTPESTHEKLMQINIEAQNEELANEPNGLLVDTSKINISAGTKRITLKFPINTEESNSPIQYQTINIDISVPGLPRQQKLKFPIPE